MKHKNEFETIFYKVQKQHSVALKDILDKCTDPKNNVEQT